MGDLDNRRPIKTRGAAWAQRLAGVLAEAGASPDLISALSVTFAALGGALFFLSGSTNGPARVACLLVAAICIQLRLICNLFDGMVAVEHRKGSAIGPIWNELPDRFADLILLASAGYAAQLSGIAGASAAGWLATAGALITAYVRELGRGLGQPADFSGPMAKPHRMAVLTAAALIACLEPMWGWRGQTLTIALGLIAVGAFITLARRTATLAKRLRESR